MKGQGLFLFYGAFMGDGKLPRNLRGSFLSSFLRRFSAGNMDREPPVYSKKTPWKDLEGGSPFARFMIIIT
jgi:hypothetical protein